MAGCCEELITWKNCVTEIEDILEIFKDFLSQRCPRAAVNKSSLAITDLIHNADDKPSDEETWTKEAGFL